jgi:hypothetical protein
MFKIDTKVRMRVRQSAFFLQIGIVKGISITGDAGVVEMADGKRVWAYWNELQEIVEK